MTLKLMFPDGAEHEIGVKEYEVMSEGLPRNGDTVEFREVSWMVTGVTWEQDGKLRPTVHLVNA